MRGLLNAQLGKHQLIDDISGRKIRSDKARMQWDGIITSGDDFSFKHPQLELRSRSENISVRPTRVQPQEVSVTSVNPDSLNGQP